MKRLCSHFSLTVSKYQLQSDGAKTKNDMKVKLYVEVKKREVGLAMSPLYIDTTDKNVGEIQDFDVSIGAIV
ncbi:hypothetical protein H5410_032746 [Solanum commersonii]|uniref:Uncharacterized protein n=1 Tax=Solanum commersonii TaxID=4109 RepID=A0A9J5YNT3_SOLCO|nr:hypothetical protein H5410_032746 [Solanum commersonii]